MIKNLLNKFSERSATEKTFVLIIIVVLIGIILRWGVIKSEIKRGLQFFKNETTEKTQ